jgi:hypothetical protein
LRLLSKPVRLGLALGTAAAVCLTMTAASSAAVSQRVTYIGAFAGTASQWNAAYATIGPLQTNKEFYNTTKLLPATFGGSTCAHLAHNPVCIVAFKTSANLNSFVESIPPHRNLVIMVYYQEPELTKNGLSPGAFTTAFDKFSGEIRKDAKDKHLTNVRVAMDAGTSQYAAPGSGHSRGYSCAYIPLPRYVDYYLADVYQPTLIGLQNDAEFQRWNHCVVKVGKGSRPQGIAEYGLGVCVPTGGFVEQDRANTLKADARYLARAFPHLLMWEYWWSTISGNPGAACYKWKFPLKINGAESPTLKDWKAIVAGTIPS